MKIKIKFTNEDPHGFRQNKPLKISLLMLGIVLTLLGGSGIVIDRFFLAYSAGYHQWAGNSNLSRFLIGNSLLFTYHLLTKKDPE